MSVFAITRLCPLMETPEGAPLSEKVIGAVPVAVSGKTAPVPSIHSYLEALVIIGGTALFDTVKVKDCVSSG